MWNFCGFDVIWERHYASKVKIYLFVKKHKNTENTNNKYWIGIHMGANLRKK